MAKIGDERVRKGIVFAKEIDGEIRYGWQSWIERLCPMVTPWGVQAPSEWIAKRWL